MLKSPLPRLFNTYFIGLFIYNKRYLKKYKNKRFIFIKKKAFNVKSCFKMVLNSEPFFLLSLCLYILFITILRNIAFFNKSG